jgi:hypothetical protein
MKHPSSRAFFTYWDQQRDGAAAPERGAIAPDAVRSLLGDIFVLSCDLPGYPVRVAGTRLCALFGRDLKGHSLPGLFLPEQRRGCTEVLDIAAGDTLAVVAGLTATKPDGMPTPLELLLLPFAPRAHTPLSMTGLLAPLDANVRGPLSGLRLTSWRVIGQQPRRFAPRALRKLKIVRGLTVYEGIR